MVEEDGSSIQTLGNETFDGVVASFTMHHWPPDKLDEMIRSLTQSLRFGGRFLVFEDDGGMMNMSMHGWTRVGPRNK